MLCAAMAVSTFGFAAAVHGQGRPQIVLFQEDNYRGSQLRLDGENARLKLDRFDDRASSVRVMSGTWELCDDDAFRGRCVTVSRDEPKLGRLGMDDRISSVRPISRRDDNRRDDNRRDDRNRRN
jgi:hypothetical protein